MEKYYTENVFGVSNDMIESYIEREQVDSQFIQGLKSKKHIIIFGSSKQGKTALTSKHISKDRYVKINCSPESQPIDIYKSLLRKINVEFEEIRKETSSEETARGGAVKANVKLPFVVDGGVGVNGEKKKSENEEKSVKKVEYNLNLPEDIAEILLKYNFDRRIIIENFHYLDDDIQNDLAFHLRVFEDYNILFVILGIWREKNRLAQFNGDLQDRLIEIPVEPWEKEDFYRVAKKGGDLLNVDFDGIVDKIIDQSFDSIGVFQELCKNTCLQANVYETKNTTIILDNENLNNAIEKKVEEYYGRHIRSIETFIEQRVKTTGEKPLYIPYYFILILLKENFSYLMSGLKRKYIENKIKDIHHRSEDVRPSDTSYFLHNIKKTQINKKITPPLFDYDRSSRTLKIIDSTLYFFLRNANIDELIDELEKPDEL